MQGIDSTTFELGEAKLALKDGLRVSIQHGRDESWYLMEDESRGEFFRLGAAEYTFLSQLNGSTTMATALATTCSLVTDCMMGEQEAASLCKWLVDNGLAHTRASTSSQRMQEKRQEDAQRQMVQALNPISIRFPIWNPDKFIERAEKLLHWMFRWPVAIFGIMTCVWAILSLSADWQRFVNPQIQVFSRHNVLWLIATWIVLKTAHEFAHAIACKHYGGRIGKSGIVLLLLIPLPFVDVTSSWRFSNKYHRILVAAAGMLAELFMAAIATLVWCRVGPGLISQQAANIMITASLHTILFNANPLMRFDGYYIFADWLEIPNLGTHGQQFVQGIAKRVFLDLPSVPLRWTGSKALLVKTYGVLAALWKVTICVSLTIGAANLLNGFGLVLAFFSITLWGIVPTWKLTKFLIHGTEFEQPNRLRCGVVGLGLIVLLVTVGVLVPGPQVVTAPIVIDYEPFTEVRAETAGFVCEVHVQPEELVAAGDLLLVMENHELETEVAELEMELQEATIEASRFRSRGEVGLYQAAEETVQALRKRRDQLGQQSRRLEIVAPVAGRVIADELAVLEGQFVTAGTSLMAIGSDDKKMAIALVAQDKVHELFHGVGNEVHLRVWGHTQWVVGDVQEVSPRALDEVPHFAFAGTAGGPLDVVHRSQVEDSQRSSAADPSALKLLEPRVQLKIGLNDATSHGLRAGEEGLAYLQADRVALGHYLFHNMTQWFRNRIRFTHGL